MTAPTVDTLPPGQLQGRKARLLSGLIGRAVAGTPTSDGYQLFFSAADPGILNAIATCINAERVHYRRLKFSLTVSPDGGPIELVVSGPQGTRRFFDSLVKFAR